MNDELKEVMDNLSELVLKEGLIRYEGGEREAKRNRELFEVVKKETKPLFELIDKWEKIVMEQIHLLPILPNQVKNTKENLELLVFHSYYRDVRKKRFMELYHSVDFIFKELDN